MTEHPILFSAPMVRAILDGSKTQTRRVVKMPGLSYVEGGAPSIDFDGFRIPRDCGPAPARFSAEAVGGGAYLSEEIFCPYGQPGDRLWVRETHRVIWGQSPGYLIGVDYQADPPEKWERMRDHMGLPRWTPSIHMKREYSRILLEVVSVRVERLNEISAIDAKQEGLKRIEYKGESFGFDGGNPTGYGSSTGAFRALWESINGAGSWTANPWVWVIEFKRVTL